MIAIDLCKVNYQTLLRNTECIRCIARKKIKSKCDFIGFRNNRLNYKCKECGKPRLSH